MPHRPTPAGTHREVVAFGRCARARTRYAFLGGVLVAGVSGLFAGAVLSGSVDLDACGPRAGTTAFDARQGPLTEASASVNPDISINAASLELTLPNQSLRGSIEANGRLGRARRTPARDRHRSGALVGRAAARFT